MATRPEIRNTQRRGGASTARNTGGSAETAPPAGARSGGTRNRYNRPEGIPERKIRMPLAAGLALGATALVGTAMHLLSQKENMDQRLKRLKTLNHPIAHDDPPCYPDNCLSTFVDQGKNADAVDQLAQRTFHKFVQDNKNHIPEFQRGGPAPQEIDWRPPMDNLRGGYPVANMGTKDGAVLIMAETIVDSRVPRGYKGKDEGLESTLYHETVHQFTSPSFVKFKQHAIDTLKAEGFACTDMELVEAFTCGLQKQAFPGSEAYAKTDVKWLASPGGGHPSIATLGSLMVDKFGADAIKSLVYGNDRAVQNQVLDYLIALGHASKNYAHS
jgi:hypothetical protein